MNKLLILPTARIQNKCACHFITLSTCLNSDFYCSYIKDSAWCLPVISQRMTQDKIALPLFEGGTAEVAFDCFRVPHTQEAVSGDFC